ncbi:MAG: exodeoxyribonuclease VII small subunit [Pseudomonadota bacterium]
MSDAEKSIETMSFEDAMQALEGIVTRLETGEASLEESISLYERGAKLREHCEAKLKAAEMKVAQITEGPDGPQAKPAEFG